MKRGEIWTLAGGAPYAAKPRPALVLQDDAYHETSSVVICPMTSEQIVTAFLRPRIEPDGGNGLLIPSRVMVDKISSVPRSNLGRRVGHIALIDLRAVEFAVLTFLGLST